MINYRAPLEDLDFLFHDVMKMQENFLQVREGEVVTPDVVTSIFMEAGKFCESELSPIYQTGDLGCVWQDGNVTTPEGFREAYSAFIAAGWTSLSGDPAYGGQGLPSSIMIAVNEMLAGANWAWSMYPGLSEGAIATLEAHGSAEQKEDYLHKLISGRWSGTMCLTEPVCGTDLGLLKTKAEEQSDGTYKISGQKIFITSGDHDLTENIIHLVLARIPGSPSGTCLLYTSDAADE